LYLLVVIFIRKHIACYWTAKEAVAKVLGYDKSKELSFNEVKDMKDLSSFILTIQVKL